MTGCLGGEQLPEVQDGESGATGPNHCPIKIRPPGDGGLGGES